MFLDRDGVLNEPVLVASRPHPPGSVAELRLAPGAPEACRRLRDAGLLLVVVTNQPDIARGTQSRETVDAINAEVARRTSVDAVLVCPHDDGDGCGCRKPAPGLLLEAAARWNLDLPRSVLVGDRWRDIDAGRAAGCATVLVDRTYDERRGTGADLVVGGLHEAVPWILRWTGTAPREKVV